MGAKDSKPSFISYEEAVKRVPDSELRRIREAFKRCASGNGTTLSPEAFVHEVLCDGVPSEVADWLFQACGGTKRGIAFKELLCGIVVLTKGSVDEKIKFLWTLYVNNQNENGLYIYKWDFARTLHMENTSLPVTNAPKTAEILTGLFGSSDKVSFEQFRSWLLIHKDATVLSKWLLTEKSYNSIQDMETPTFYQSLAGVTHLEERDIIELEKCFWSLRNAAATSQLDLESLSPLLSPPLPPAAVAGTFLAFDENRDGHVDFKELCCGLSAACRGPRTERLKFCFKIFDLDRDGVLKKKELVEMVDILCEVANESLKTQSSRASTPDGGEPLSPEKSFDPDVILLNLKDKLISLPKINTPMFQLGPTCLDTDDQEAPNLHIAVTPDASEQGLDAALTQEDFLIWSVESADALVTPFLELLFDVCHVVLGLRPQCRHQERDIVLGWLRRATAAGLCVGQFWYLVGAEWWASWAAHCAAPDHCCRQRHDEALGTDDSFTTNSTESMGSLLYRADTASLGSASSSGVSSAGPARHPGPVDNKRLLAHNVDKVPTLTGEGGHLRRDVTLSQHRDFELVPDALWRALALWYGGPDPLPRQVIRPPDSDVELELYPLQLNIYRHVPSPQRPVVAGGALYGAGAAPAPPDRQLAYTAAFSRLATVRQVTEFLCAALRLAREDVRLWALGTSGAVLLDDDTPRLQELALDARRRLLLERRRPDLTWPEESGALSMGQAGSSGGTGGSGAGARRGTLRAPDLPGATGLHNLGNTCYMNAALQAVWNTGPLTRYFNSGMHLYEVNPHNPLGTRGALALRYGELCKEVWSMRARSVAPLRVRWCVARWARGLAGGGQHDAQELLAWLLDALHEDLNRAAPAGRQPARAADSSDQAAAAAAWEQHCASNRSVLNDLFYGLLKSKVRCGACGTDSARFEAFNMLSLPLPMDAAVPLDVRVVRLDGSVPVRYGVRAPADCSWRDLKLRLAPLCGLPPELMLVVEVSGAVISRVLSDSARARPGASVAVYELPGTAGLGDHTAEYVGGSCLVGAEADASDASDEPARQVSGARAAPSLCMPALFCFKRSRSEVLMSQSPPSFYEGKPKEQYRSNTLPKELKRNEGNSSPTLSVKSLNIRPSSPRLKVQFGSSPSDMNRMNETKEQPVGSIQYLIAVHRKQCRLDAYFLPGGRSRPLLFGEPILVPLQEGMTGRELYARVWTQLARLLSARPASEQHNHATDCDDSLGYEFPFTLRLVNSSGAWCALCPWSALCRGCALHSEPQPLLRNLTCAGPSPSPSAPSAPGTPAPRCAPPRDSPVARAKLQRHASLRDNTHNGETQPKQLTELDFNELRQLWARGGRTLGAGSAPVLLAIDWDPTALHLRYQALREKACVEHPSVVECLAEAARPVDLHHCLTAFTSEERLEQPYHCASCKTPQPASKKLQLWRLPPILIIHLKRFQYVNNKWIKSQKVVNFPYQDFDPSAYLAAVPQETILRHHELKHMFKRRDSQRDDCSDTDDDSDSDERERDRGTSNSRASFNTRTRLQSSSLTAAPVLDHELRDYHQHRLQPARDPFSLNYRLYAVVSHSGQLSGGHYVAYARNPSGVWLCYNDSMCRELSDPPPIDPASAYLLFYERQGLDTEAYLPDITGKEPVGNPDALDPDESDLKKMCSIA